MPTTSGTEFSRGGPPQVLPDVSGRKTVKKAPPPRLDLHLHTNRSDGRFDPAEVLERAAQGSLDVIAPADHDQPPALGPGVHQVGGRELRVIGATEVSGLHDGHELHLLVYFPGAFPEDYAGWLRERSVDRARAYDVAAARLGLPEAGPEAHAGGRAATRFHLARGLWAAGRARGSSDAFPQLAAAGVGPLVHVSFLEVIQVARDAGGLCSWAHPSLAAVSRWVSELARAGLQGLEVHRPRLDRPTRNGLKRAAARHGLLATGGSDWHGWTEGRLGLYALQGEPGDAFLRRLDRLPAA